MSRSLRIRFAALAGHAMLVSAVAAGCDRRGSLEFPTCDVNEAGISDSTIGPLHIDEALPALRVRCPAVGDTMVTPFGFIDSVPALRLVVVGAPVVVLHDGKKVTTLRVESPAFRTNDSLGVGTSVPKFRNLSGIRVSRTGAPFGVLRDRRRCGVTYELSGWGMALPPTETDPLVRGAALAGWPDSIVVRAVAVSGCRGLTRDLGVDSLVEAFADSEAVVDSSTYPPIPPQMPHLPPEPAEGTPRPDSGSAAAPSPSVRVLPPPFPMPVEPTPAELAELRSRLDVPVQGVTRSQLRDTYAESRGGRTHDALDIPAARGTPVMSAADGRVLKLFNSKAGGLMVYATDASERFILLYGHLDRYANGLADGTRLARGQVIGYVGTTGNAPIATPHLHFGIMRGRPSVSWWSGVPVNPYPLLVPGRD